MIPSGRQIPGTQHRFYTSSKNFTGAFEPFRTRHDWVEKVRLKKRGINLRVLSECQFCGRGQNPSLFMPVFFFFDLVFFLFSYFNITFAIPFLFQRRCPVLPFSANMRNLAELLAQLHPNSLLLAFQLFLGETLGCLSS